MTNGAVTAMPCSGIKPMNKTQFTKDSIEAAYCFFHQKWQVYAFSNSERQKDDIEYAISEYVNEMSPALYEALAQGKEGFLSSFADDMKSAVKQLEEQL